MFAVFSLHTKHHGLVCGEFAARTQAIEAHCQRAALTLAHAALLQKAAKQLPTTDGVDLWVASRAARSLANEFGRSALALTTDPRIN